MMAAQQPDEVAEPRTTATVGGTAAGELTGNTHYIVQQPDNTVDVAIHTERLEELKVAAAAQAAANPQAQVGCKCIMTRCVCLQNDRQNSHQV
jgi:hypothetical protein